MWRSVVTRVCIQMGQKKFTKEDKKYGRKKSRGGSSD